MCLSGSEGDDELIHGFYDDCDGRRGCITSQVHYFHDDYDERCGRMIYLGHSVSTCAMTKPAEKISHSAREIIPRLYAQTGE